MLFADLVGSTKLATQLDPEDLRGRLEPFFEAARSALEQHGGTVEKYIGDAVMAVFGAPVAHGDDPDRAVAAGLAVAERVSAARRRARRPGRDRNRRGPLGRRAPETCASPARPSTPPPACSRPPSRARCWSASGPRAPAGGPGSRPTAPSRRRAFPAPSAPTARSRSSPRPSSRPSRSSAGTTTSTCSG